VPDATVDDNHLPFGLSARLAGSGGPWHALALAVYCAEVAGRQVIMVRPGLPPRRALLGAVHAAVEELYRIALLVAREGEREAGARRGGSCSSTPSLERPTGERRNSPAPAARGSRSRGSRERSGELAFYRGLSLEVGEQFTAEVLAHAHHRLGRG